MKSRLRQLFNRKKIQKLKLFSRYDEVWELGNCVCYDENNYVLSRHLIKCLYQGIFEAAGHLFGGLGFRKTMMNFVCWLCHCTFTVRLTSGAALTPADGARFIGLCISYRQKNYGHLYTNDALIISRKSVFNNSCIIIAN